MNQTPETPSNSNSYKLVVLPEGFAEGCFPHPERVFLNEGLVYELGELDKAHSVQAVMDGIVAHQSGALGRVQFSTTHMVKEDGSGELPVTVFFGNDMTQAELSREVNSLRYLTNEVLRGVSSPVRI